MPKDLPWRFKTTGDVDLEARTIAPVRANAGFRIAYQRRLDRLIDEMQRSLVHWITAAWRRNPPVALDASPAMELRRTIRKLKRRWMRNFDRAALELADYFAQGVNDRSARQLQDILRRGGFSVQFKMTAAQNDAYQAIIGENVGLIKSIAQEHLAAVEGHVMRSVSQGRALGDLSKELEAQYSVTKRRAALIARDQNNKATATLTRVRQQELGITQAVWVHSAGSKKPRKTHLAMNGQKYDVDKGMWDPEVQKWIWPGELINCRCVSRSVIPGFE